MERRKPQYLSPTNIKLFFKDREEWYFNYISPVKPPRMPQTVPMAIGSAFDAYVKAELYHLVYGDGDERFSFPTLFESQVESQNRDTARKDGLIAFTIYKDSGAYADLVAELEFASDSPRFEIEVRGPIPEQHENIKKPVGGLVLLGKPDLCFLDREARMVIYDWKVNGFYSNSKTYPKRGYISCRTRTTDLGQHKDCITLSQAGLRYNSTISIEEVESDWATQLATYAWVSGELIGSNFLVGIDQLAGKPAELRVAKHRSLISKAFQLDVYRKYCQVQIAIETGHYFDHLTLEQNTAYCDDLDRQAIVLNDTSDPFAKRRGT